MPNFKQAGRLLQFTSVLPKDTLLIHSMEGVEGMSRMFDIRAELLAETGTDIDPAALVGTKATIAISTLDTKSTRYLNGLIAALEQTSGDSNFDVYRVHMVPSLWQLTLSSNCRIFQSMAPMDIIKKVIAPYGLTLKDQTSSLPSSLEYVTQYNESDFNFISRIMEKFGIFYWFQHAEDDNTVVFGDSRDGYSTDSFSMDYAPQIGSHDERYSPVILDIRATAAMVTGTHSYRDYDFTTKSLFGTGPVQSGQAAGKNAYEWYSYPAAGSSAVKSKGQSQDSMSGNPAILTAQADASDVSFNVFQGVATSRSLYPGSLISMAKHPRSAWNRDYLLTELSFHVDQVPDYTGDNKQEVPFTAHFAAIESSRMFRPVARTPKPRVAGPQPALVVGPSGEEIYLDKYGRIKVQFPWDREGKSDENSSAFVRVGQPWAGSGWGTYFWPRMGDEVLVQFMNGDPDDPLVIGSVYNGVNMEKYALPDMSTRTGILTRSSKGGTADNANELRFEDKKGSEQIFINAEKDMDHRVENDLRTYVMGQDSMIVDKDQLEQVGGSYNRSIKGDSVEAITGKQDLAITGAVTHKLSAAYGRSVGGDSLEKIDGKQGLKVTKAVSHEYSDNFSLKVDQSHGHKVGMSYALEAGMDAYIKGGMSVTIEAGMELTLKAAGGFINIGPAGVSISGPMVLINSGGAAGAGTPPTITPPDAPTDPGTPKDPDKADDGTKGTKM